MQLTEHFSDAELGVRGGVACLIDNARALCEQLLEPIRERFGVVHVTSGYRDPDHNARVGGKPNSFHLYQDCHAAADIVVSGQELKTVFDWIRLESGLPFDEVILEHNNAGVPRCVHIQIKRGLEPRRWALVGSTGAAHDYEQVEVA